MQYNIPRVMISSVKSKSGKTMISAALGKLLSDKGLDVSMFKCGPDYVDARLHKEITKNAVSNLDLFFDDESLLRQRFCQRAQGRTAIIEGAMGFYDGMCGNTKINSAFDISQCIMAPVVLIIDAEGSSFSMCALIKGFLSFRENNIKAVILNRCSASLYSVLKPVIEAECKISVLGFIPKDERLKIRNQKLGLSLEEKDELKSALGCLCEIINKNVDLNRLAAIMKSAQPITVCCEKALSENLDLNVAVARDEAFAFCYDDNIRFLESNGCNISFFSPMHDKSVPKNTNVCIFGGGYIEKNAKALSENESMLSSVRSFYSGKGAIIAEGSGFIYINASMEDENRECMKLCRILEGRCKAEEKLVNFGYITLFDNEKRPVLKGHEFHYSSCTDDGNSFTARRFKSQKSRKTIFYNDRLFCGFPQFDFTSNRDFFTSFLRNIKKR